MARPGVYKSEVRKARAVLMAHGKYPSVDAVRAALGNTGSKSTLHRLLKEIEQETGESPPTTLSTELQSLVQRLAERLHADADERAAAALEPLEAERREHAHAITRWQTEAQHFRDQLEQTEQALTAAQAAHSQEQKTLADTRLALEQWQERAAGLERQLAARDGHLKSIEDKYAHAQEALTHFRQAAKEQRDQELRRHEHERQGLQVELRRAQDSLVAKTQDLLQLNRDNERLTGRVGQLETAVRDAELDVRQQRQQLAKHAELEQQHRELSARWALLIRGQAQMEEQLKEQQRRADSESQRRLEAEQLLARTQARLDAIEHTIERLRGPASLRVTAPSDQTALTSLPQSVPTAQRDRRKPRRNEHT